MGSSALILTVIVSHLSLSMSPIHRILHSHLPHPCVPPLGSVLMCHKVRYQSSAAH